MKKKAISGGRKAYILTMRILMGAAAVITAALVLFLIAYVLIKGLPNVTWTLLSTAPSYLADRIGILPDILNTLYIVIATLLIVLPLGVGAAIYLTEYATNRRLIGAIEYAAETLSGIPSIIYGLVGMLFFCQFLNMQTSLLAGALTLVIWTMTLVTTVKYVVIAMKADNHNEGGIFALFSLVRKVAPWLILPAMIGGAALLADGILTPAVTVTTAIEGLRTIEWGHALLGDGQTNVIIITIIIICGLFAMQRAGTSSIGKLFGPLMTLWFLFLAGAGLFNMLGNLSILRALNPIRGVMFLFSPINHSGIMVLGFVFLSTTGAEALYSDMGHVGKANIYASWPFVKAALILNYLGQGAWLLANNSNPQMLAMNIVNPFYMMLPESLRPFAIVLSAVAAIIASQALITGSFSLVSEATRLNLMPHLRIHYPSDTKGQLYIPLVNNIMWVGCIFIVLLFQNSERMESAYGLAITVTMLMTTTLLTSYIAGILKHKLGACVFALLFGAIELCFFASCLTAATS